MQHFSSEELKQELNDVEKLTEERLDEVLATFLSDFDAGEAEARGWPAAFAAYKVAKAAMNAYSGSWRGGTPSCASTARIPAT